MAFIEKNTTKQENCIMESALLDYLDKMQRSVIKKMKSRGFEDYKAPVLGIETDKEFMEAAKKFIPDTVERYLVTLKLYNEI